MTVRSDAIRAQYEQSPYRDPALPELDLSRLLGMARLFSLGPSAEETACLRVLDLGCASGAHIREQAARYPTVRFTGVDFSQSETDLGRKAIERAGLDNVELLESDLREWDIEPDAFDLILCHGTFSWVPDDVKDRILALCRMGLKAHGVAVVAYLTYPGWKQREAIRELLSFRVREVRDPDERIRQSALVLRLLQAGYASRADSCHAQSLQAVVESMQESRSNVFLHDELGSIHDPCYFVQFVEWAVEWGLQYLAEVDISSMTFGALPASAAGLLRELSPDFVETQQLLDFLVNRSGRTSIVVRDDASVARGLDANQLHGLCFTTSLTRTGPQRLTDGPPTEFRTIRGETVTTDDPFALAIVRQLLAAYPEPVPFAEVEAASRTHSGELSEMLTSLISNGWAEPRLHIG